MTSFYKYKLINILDKNEKQYTSLKQIARDLNVDYFAIRALNQHSMKPKKYLHSRQKALSDKYQIVLI
jgi:hypothetical protein